MKNTTFIPFIILCVLGFTSCVEPHLEVGNDNNLESNTKLEETKYNILNNDAGIYLNYFLQSDFSAGYSSLKANSLQPHNVVEFIDFKNAEMKLSIKKEPKNDSYLYKTEKKSKHGDIFGKDITFKLQPISSKNGHKKEAGFETTFYVPNLVEITNPKVEKEIKLFPNCYAKNFVLEWNSDPKNENGLMVIVQYNGLNAHPSYDTNKPVINIDVIKEDNGRTVLNDDLFKDIPNLSIVTIILLRGHVTLEEVQGKYYKFFAESHVKLPIVLVKDINSVKAI
ncbi:hypothetical protein [Polaribacter cellanae]|uniref:Lipoprotein n=1 Tax=Polaribacter cellanae TaxID=2818493 RepID=A0A975CTK5_9FLAO|nr:hypothetical protein [Polaribacter cellanae]QTE23847.1 hypothetical protein J3359_06150 [Polaribacter cellanae]